MRVVYAQKIYIIFGISPNNNLPAFYYFIINIMQICAINTYQKHEICVYKSLYNAILFKFVQVQNLLESVENIHNLQVSLMLV